MIFLSLRDRMQAIGHYIFMRKEIKEALENLGFSTNETAVYIALTQLGESPIAIIAKKAELPRTTVASILLQMANNGYVSSHVYRRKTWYWVESPRTIERMLENRIAIAQELNGLLTDFYRSEADFPEAKVFDTKTSMKAFIEKLMVTMKDGTLILTLDTPGAANYTKIYSENFDLVLREIKRKKKIITHTLIPMGTGARIDPRKLMNRGITLREMPAGVQGFQASFWIIDDLFVQFSGRYPFIVSVRHSLIAESMRAIFQYLWSVSTPVKK